MDTTRHGAGDAPHFRAIVGHDPYPWQRALYAALLGGEAPGVVRLPTGLGKTVCVLLLLLARVHNRSLPTRIVYVVDRRAIVNQNADRASRASPREHRVTERTFRDTPAAEHGRDRRRERP